MPGSPHPRRFPDRRDHDRERSLGGEAGVGHHQYDPVHTNNAKTLLASGGAIWLTNVIAFGLWYWDLDRGGAAARAHGEGRPTFVFPEMTNSQYVEAG